MIKKLPGRPKKFTNSQTMAVQLEACTYSKLDKMSHEYSLREGRVISKGDLIRTAITGFIQSTQSKSEVDLDG